METHQNAKSNHKEETHKNTSFSLYPPGWNPIYEEFSTPVFPMENPELNDIITSLTDVGQIATFDIKLPELGNNKEHISLHMYTLNSKRRENERFLVIDVHINEFSEWLPQEKGDYTYPNQNSLQLNGPYYVELQKNLTQLLGVGPFSFDFIEYNKEEDYAIYSVDISLSQFF